MTVGRRLMATAVIGCVVVANSVATRAALTSRQEYGLKAAFLYNFAKFIDWPADSFADDGSPLIFGVLGSDPFGSALDKTLQGKTVRGRSLVIRRFREVEDVRACHILFVGRSEGKRLAQTLESLQGSAVVTVGETKGFARVGGIINFFTEQDKLRFEINVEAAEREGLKISAHLLNLARVLRA